MKRTIALCVGLLLLAVQAKCGELDFAKAIHYSVPTNVLTPVIGALRHDPGDNPLSLDGPGCQYGSADNSTWLIFQTGLVRAYIGQGKVVHFLPVEPSTLKEDLENQYRTGGEGGQGKFSSVTPATISKINGRTAVSLTATRAGGNPSLFLFCWIQIETNIALKITAVSSKSEAFEALTNSLQSVKIDKTALFAALTPKKPELTTNHLEKVEIGYMPWRNARVAAFVFHCQGKIYSFAAFGAGVPDQTLGWMRPSLEKLRDTSTDATMRRMVVIVIAPTGDGPNDVQRTCHFIIEPASSQMVDLHADYFPITPVMMFSEEWENKMPASFEKSAEYKMDAKLVIRKTWH